MRRWFIFTSLVLGVSLVLSGTASQVYAASEAEDARRVAVAEDTTIASECTISVDGGPPQACPPGSVINIYETTLGQAKQAKVKDYVVLSDDKTKNEDLKANLALRVRREKHGEPVTAASCAPKSNISLLGSYLDVPADPNSIRISYEVNYAVGTDCRVTNVRDRTKASGSGLKWTKSCTHNAIGGQCNLWDIALNGTFTSFKPEQASWVGFEYGNYTYGSCCGNQYGYTDFIN